MDIQPDIDDLIRELSAEITQVYRWVAEQAGLNQTDLMGLYFISRSQGAATPKSLAENLGLTSGATTILLNRLEARDFVVRTPHPTDRRGVLLSLGDAARNQEFIRLRQTLFGINASVIAKLSPDDAVVVRKFIANIVANTRDSLRQYRNAAGKADQNTPLQ